MFSFGAFILCFRFIFLLLVFVLKHPLSGTCGGGKERKGPVGMGCIFEFHIPVRPYWEYFGRGVANRTPSPFQACDGVQLQINIKNKSIGVLLDQFY